MGIRGDIRAPARSGPAGVTLVLGAIAAPTALVVLGPEGAARLPGGAAAASIATAAVAAIAVAGGAALRETEPVHLGLLVLAMLATAAAGVFGPWPAPVVAALAAYGLAVRFVPALRRSVGWLALGRIDRATALLVAATALVSGAALAVWFAWAKPDLAIFRAEIPPWPVPALVALAVLFAVANAFAEEAVYRGVVMQAFEAAFGTGALSLLAQAAAFGLLHIRGFPQGWVGVGMSAGYGLMLGYLRRRSRGMLAPWAAHVAADLVIFAIVAALAAP